jgi:hypothetical protein
VAAARNKHKSDVSLALSIILRTSSAAKGALGTGLLAHTEWMPWMTRFSLGLSNGVDKPCKDVKKPTAAMALSTAATDPELLARSTRKASRLSASAGREGHPRSGANLVHLY